MNENDWTEKKLTPFSKAVAATIHGRLNKKPGRLTLMRMIVLFGCISLLLGGIGIYGVMTYFVAQRRREMGVRLALGATRESVTRMVLSQGVRMTAVGLILGIGGALAGSRFIRSLLFEIEPTDPTTHVAVALILSTVAVLATWIPARRAARVDPVEAFRED